MLIYILGMHYRRLILIRMFIGLLRIMIMWSIVGRICMGLMEPVPKLGIALIGKLGAQRKRIGLKLNIRNCSYKRIKMEGTY